MRPYFRYDATVGAGSGPAAVSEPLIEIAVGEGRVQIGAAAPCLPLPAIQGVLIGYLFERSGRHRREGLTSAEQLAILSTRGRHLVERHSGAYVTIWRDATDGSVKVLRDPSAMQPVLLVLREGRFVVVSDLSLLPEIALSIDWDQLASALRYPELASATRPLHDVIELLPGELASFDGARLTRSLCWSPRSFLPLEPGQFDAHARRVEQAVDDAVAGWASLASVRLELSGGLDSSILAASLARSGRSWDAITFATDARDGDEREHARSVADHCGAELLDLRLIADPADAIRPLGRRLAHPTGMAMMRGVDRLIQAQGSKHDTLFSGGGGDNVFAFLSSTGPVLDAWHLGGRSAAWDAVSDLADLHDGTRRQVLRRVVRRLVLSLIGRAGVRQDMLLAAGAGRRRPCHAWLDPGAARLPGSEAHIAALVAVHSVLDAHDRYASRSTIFPLLSQPVLEACLSVPSWMWNKGGRDRAVARAAFAERLPAAILARRTKGRLESLVAALYDGARAELRVLMLEGRLMQQGLLDRPRVEATLARPASGRDWQHARILQLADAELWVRSIEGSAGRLPA